MENSQDIYEKLATSLSRQAINLDTTNRKKSERINKITQELNDSKFARPLVSVTAFQPSKSMDPTIVTTLRAEEATIIAAAETQIQTRRLAALQSDHASAIAELAKFTNPTDLRNKITQLLPILGNQPTIVTNISNDIAIRINNHQSERARKAAAVPAPEPMVVEQPPAPPPSLESLQSEVRALVDAVRTLQANDNGSRHRQRGSADTNDGTQDNNRRQQGPPRKSRSPSAQPRRNRDDRDDHDSGNPRNQSRSNSRGQQKSKASSRNSRK